MIALTPNLARRRIFRIWETWVRMLAGTLPVWIVPLLIAMAFPVMKDSKIMFKGGLMVFGACSCCDGGGTPGVTCFQCDAGMTPLTWSVTFTSVDTAMPCMLDTGSSNGYSQSHGDSFTGTYTLTQRPSPNLCEWIVDVSSPSLDTDGTLGDCSDTISQGSGTLRITILTTSTTLTLRAEPTAGNNIDFFQKIITTTACCSSHTFTNANTAYGWDGTHFIGGINGSGLATPHC